jgi:hypothetical protein
MVRFKHYAQLQHYKGWTVEFQPDHLLCDRCWELTSTAFSEALINGHRTGHIKLNRLAADLTPTESHGMTATITKETP